jgi:hypothetical protein
MSIQCRYVIAQFFPDLIRREPTNIGVILQTDEFIEWRFLESFDFSRRTDFELAIEGINSFFDLWGKKPDPSKTISIYLPGWESRKETFLTDPAFLIYLRNTFTRHIQFSDIRVGEISLLDGAHFEVYLDNLFKRFVMQRPIEKLEVSRKSFGPRIHTRLRQKFREKKWDGRMQEDPVLKGTIDYTFDFRYKARENTVIATLELMVKDPLTRTESLIGQLADIKKTGVEEPFESMIVFIRPSLNSNHEKSEKLIRTWATHAFNLETENKLLESKLEKDLRFSDSFGFGRK